MNEEMYYRQKYDSSLKAIGEIVTYIIIGIALASIMYEVFYEMLYVGDYDTGTKMVKIQSVLPFIPIPYGLKKTWRSCLVLRSGSVEMWVLWIFYISIKMVIALFYGLFGIPVFLIGNILSAIDYKGKMNKAAQPFNQISNYQMNMNNTYGNYNQNSYYDPNVNVQNVNGTNNYDGRNYYG